MSKLNQASKGAQSSVVKVAAKHELKVGTSANGNLQFIKTQRDKLYELAVGGLFGNDRVASDTAMLNQVQQLVRSLVEQGDANFVANLAVHSRTVMNIRTLPVIIIVELARTIRDFRHAGKPVEFPALRQAVRDVIQRADQITDLYAYALKVFGNKKLVPAAIKRGVADAFNKFSEYQFAKYNRPNDVKLRDVLRIVHAAPKDITQSEVFSRIIADTLQVPYTWETQLSANGQLPASERKSKEQLWTELLKSGQMGYMALIRNLRNVVEAGVDSAVLREHALNVIKDPVRVAKGKMLPQNYLEAITAVGNHSIAIKSALEAALDASVANIPKFGDKVWIIVDYSGSMGHGTSSAFEQGLFLAATVLKANASSDLAVTAFGSDAKQLTDINVNSSVFNIMSTMRQHRAGSIAGSTNFHRALAQHGNLGFVPDTIVVITDGEVNGFPYHVLTQSTSKADVKLAVNMSRAQTTPMIAQAGWHSLSGWSPAMFQWINAIREGQSAISQLSGPYKPLA